jgi:3-hydroxyisobutyrate dehydrogenase-like beta-hydroxyacid dehydrogenase
MPFASIGLLHPGDMGAGIGAALVGAGHTVSWASEGRSPASARRAAAAGLVDVRSVEAMVERCDLSISFCPPDVALDTAKEVAGFRGSYLDANAIAPETAREVAAVVEQRGGRYLDGGIIGAPPTASGSPRLYLSGLGAGAVRGAFAGTDMDVRVISENPTAASALKMCYAAWTKGSAALLLDVRALAVAEGVEEPLLSEWQTSLPDLAARSLQAAAQATSKGWRWTGEMDQIAQTFRSAGLPDGFHRAAAEVYTRPGRDERAVADTETLHHVLGALSGAVADVRSDGQLPGPLAGEQSG